MRDDRIARAVRIARAAHDVHEKHAEKGRRETMGLLDVARIMSAASELRLAAGFTKPPHSAKRLMEKCFPDVLVTGDRLPRGVAELVLVAEGKRTIIYNRGDSTDAHRLAIMHGLGHLIFDAPNGQHQCPLSATARHKHPDEVRADIFAAEVLVPFAELDEFFRDVRLFPRDPVEKRHFADTLDHAASRFHVPQKFMKWRVRDLSFLRRTSFATSHG